MNVLDSSAILALLLGEPIQADMTSYFTDAVISAVNYAEAIAVLTRRGYPVKELDLVITNTAVEVVFFDMNQAWDTGHLLQRTRRWGLSLGDCACLSLAQRIDGIAVTTDRVWSSLDFVEVRVIR